MTLDDIHGRLTLSVPEAAELLGIGKGLAYDAARNGEIPTISIGRRLVVPVHQLLHLLGVPPEQQAAPAGINREGLTSASSDQHDQGVRRGSA